jgi:hypothetical protein
MRVDRAYRVQSVSWWILLVIAALVFAAVKIVIPLRRLRAQQRLPKWDEQKIRQLRDQGLDPFVLHELDFFFEVPDEGAAREIARALEQEGFATDIRALAADAGGHLSLHARKHMRLVVDEVSALSTRFTALATGRGGRYDGWIVAGARERRKRPEGPRPRLQ